jgi:hypothetical protein
MQVQSRSPVFSNELRAGFATDSASLCAADEKLTAFLELEVAIRSSNGHDRAAVPV